MHRYYFTFVTSTRHIMRSSNGGFGGDQEAEIFAHGLLNSADRSIVSVEVWERSRLVSRAHRD